MPCVSSICFIHFFVVVKGMAYLRVRGVAMLCGGELQRQMLDYFCQRAIHTSTSCLMNESVETLTRRLTEHLTADSLLM